jgi:hypothetical protein
MSHNPYPILRAPAEPAATRVFVRGVRLVDVHHHGPLEGRHGAGYCVQTLERLTSPGSGGRLIPVPS